MISGDRIKRYRLEKNMTQEQLAESSELSPNYICQIENGRKQAGIGALIKIAGALKVSATHLIKEMENSEFTPNASDLTEEVLDCDAWEMAIIYDMVRNLKQSLRANRQ